MENHLFIDQLVCLWCKSVSHSFQFFTQMINSALFDLNMGTFTLCVKDLSFVKWEGWLMEPKCSVREGGGMAHKRSSSEDKDDVRHLNSDFLIRYRLLLFLFSSKTLNIRIK